VRSWSSQSIRHVPRRLVSGAVSKLVEAYDERDARSPGVAAHHFKIISGVSPATARRPRMAVSCADPPSRRGKQDKVIGRPATKLPAGCRVFFLLLMVGRSYGQDHRYILRQRSRGDQHQESNYRPARPLADSGAVTDVPRHGFGRDAGIQLRGCARGALRMGEPRHDEQPGSWVRVRPGHDQRPRRRPRVRHPVPLELELRKVEGVSSGGPSSGYDKAQAGTGLVTCGDGQMFRAQASWEWNGTDVGLVWSSSVVIYYC
jgi:hypothetical protein